MARKRDDTVKLVLRLPPALHRQLTRIATRNNQSLNSEMVERLERSLPIQVEPHQSRWTSAKFPQTEMNEKLDRIIALLEAGESKDKGEKK